MTDKIHAALTDIADMTAEVLRDYPQVRHWIDYQRANHLRGTDYDRDGGMGSGEVRDLSVRVLRPDDGTRYAKRLERAVKAAHVALVEIDSIRRANLPATNEAGFTGDDDAMWCRVHLEVGSREPRATGDECRACADFRRAFKRKPTKAEVDIRARTGRWPRNTQVVA